MKIAILGFAREGQSVLKFLQNRRLTQRGTRTNAEKFPRRSALSLRKSTPEEIWIVDKKATIKIPSGCHAQLGKNYLKNLERFDIVFRSPGTPYNLPQPKKARRAGTKFSSATKIFFENCPAKIIGITGTKGKGTTSTLLYRILKSSGRKVFLAGNIGKPALDILPRLSALNQRKSAFVILELSSFQLQDLDKSPEIAVVLDVFPDHQDAHQNLKEYYEAKTSIVRFQKPGDKIFFSKNNKLSRRTAQKGKGRKIAVDEKKFKLFRPEDLKIKGWHNFQNAAMAATVARSLGVPDQTIKTAVKKFKGNEHRLEFVRRIGKIKFYNDSASTAPQTAAAAVKSFPGEEKILIAGGRDKDLDYKPLAKALKNSETKLVVLFGENRKKIKRQIANSKVPVVLRKTLNDAVRTAHKFATFAISPLPLAIIFSPGAASFDMFENYADRGRQFKKIVCHLTKARK